MSTIGQLVIGLSKSAGVEMRGAQKTAILTDLRGAYGSCVRDPDTAPAFREDQELSLPEQEKLDLRPGERSGRIPGSPDKSRMLTPTLRARALGRKQPLAAAEVASER